MKGLSPLIAIVILVAITIMIATIISTWSTSMMKSQQNTIENKTTTAVECTAADVNIDSVYIDFNANISRVIVRNSGQTNYDIVSAKLLNDAGESCIYTNASNLTSGPISLSKGDMLTIEFNITNVITSCANFSRATVSTSCVAISDTFDGNPNCYP